MEHWSFYKHLFVNYKLHLVPKQTITFEFAVSFIFPCVHALQSSSSRKTPALSLSIISFRTGTLTSIKCRCASRSCTKLMWFQEWKGLLLANPQTYCSTILNLTFAFVQGSNILSLHDIKLKVDLARVWYIQKVLYYACITISFHWKRKIYHTYSMSLCIWRSRRLASNGHSVSILKNIALL